MVNRKDFRPTSNARSMSHSDRELIRNNKSRTTSSKGVIKDFIDGKKSKTANQSLTSDGSKLYSYNTVIAHKQKDGTVLVNQTRYSNTTSKQQFALKEELKNSKTPYAVTSGHPMNYESEDLSGEKKDESQGAKHYSELAKKDSEHSKEYSEMAKDEREHKKTLQNIEREERIEIVPVQVPRGIGNNPSGGKTDTHYKIVKYGYIFPTKESAEKYSREHEIKNGVVIDKKEQSRKMTTKKYQSMSNEERRDYDKQQRDLQY